MISYSRVAGITFHGPHLPVSCSFPTLGITKTFKCFCSSHALCCFNRFSGYAPEKKIFTIKNCFITSNLAWCYFNALETNEAIIVNVLTHF